MPTVRAAVGSFLAARPLGWEVLSLTSDAAWRLARRPGGRAKAGDRQAAPGWAAVATLPLTHRDDWPETTQKSDPIKQPKLPTVATYSERMRELFYMYSATNKPYHYCTSLPSLLNSFFKKDKDRGPSPSCSATKIRGRAEATMIFNKQWHYVFWHASKCHCVVKIPMISPVQNNDKTTMAFCQQIHGRESQLQSNIMKLIITFSFIWVHGPLRLNTEKSCFSIEMRRKGPGLQFKRIPRDEEEDLGTEKPGTQVRIFSSKLSLENFSWWNLARWWCLGRWGGSMCIHSGAGRRGDRQQELCWAGQRWLPVVSLRLWAGLEGAWMTALGHWDPLTCLRAGKGLTDQAVAGRSPARDLSAGSFQKNAEGEILPLKQRIPPGVQIERGLGRENQTQRGLRTAAGHRDELRSTG